MNSNEMVNIIEALIQKNLGKDIFRLAEITAVGRNNARVKFDGETSASTKYYPVMSTAMMLAVGERVIMARIKGGYVVLGRLGSGMQTSYNGVIKLYPYSSSGDDVAIGTGGRTIIGGGEAAQALMEYLGAGSGIEQMHVASDNDVYIETDLQNGEAGRKTWRFDENGILYRPRYLEGNGYNVLTQRADPTSDSPYLIQETNITVASTATTGYSDISFPTAFDTVPEWVITMPNESNSVYWTSAPYNVTSSGCRVYTSRANGGTSNVTIAVRVIACGRKA